MSCARCALILTLLSVGASCSDRDRRPTTVAGQGTMTTGATTRMPNTLEPFASGDSPPQLTVQASTAQRAGSPTIAFSGVLQDPDMVSVAQFRLVRQTGTGWQPGTAWMDLTLAGGRWEESTGRYNGQLMQHMTVTPGTYRIVVRAQDSKGSVSQAVSAPVSIR